MEIRVKIPAAFSVRDDHEFTAFKHLVARLHPELRVSPVGFGRHVTGGYTVHWGLVHLEGQAISREEFEAALREAGFCFEQPGGQLDYRLAS